VKRSTIIIGLAALTLVGCASIKQPAFTRAQADSFNDCMKDQADTHLFGVAGYVYQQDVETRCQQYALASPTAIGEVK
jgi:hypothetical protein